MTPAVAESRFALSLTLQDDYAFTVDFGEASTPSSGRVPNSARGFGVLTEIDVRHA